MEADKTHSKMYMEYKGASQDNIEEQNRRPILPGIKIDFKAQ